MNAIETAVSLALMDAEAQLLRDYLKRLDALWQGRRMSCARRLKLI